MAIERVSGQTDEAANGGAGTTLVAVLPNNPAAGNTVKLAFGFYNAAGGGTTVGQVTILDASLNAYTITPSSPSTYNSTSGHIFLAYLNNAPANASKTITVTISNANWALGNVGFVWAKEYTPTGGTMDFDSDAKGTGTNSTINTPSIPVNGSGESVFAATAFVDTISSADSPFTAVGTIPNTYGWAAEDALNRSAATAVAYTGPFDFWTGMGMSFSFTPSVGGPTKQAIISPRVPSVMIS